MLFFSDLTGPVVSLNRFERKKNLPLAVEALAWALREMGAEEASRRGLGLVVAGEGAATISRRRSIWRG